MSKRLNIPAMLKAELEKAQDWEIVRGTRHLQIRIAGQLAGIIPPNSGDRDRRAIKNVISQVRRVREALA